MALVASLQGSTFCLLNLIGLYILLLFSGNLPPEEASSGQTIRKKTGRDPMAQKNKSLQDAMGLRLTGLTMFGLAGLRIVVKPF